MEESLNVFASRKELWQSRINAYRTSGLTAKEWCEQNNVSISSLRYWITKSNREAAEDVTESEDTVFARLPTEAEADQLISCAPVTIYKNGIRIELSTDCPPEMMRTLIHVLCFNA